MEYDAILIAGPTASGKSSLALKIAQGICDNGLLPVIINADSMQVYRELRVISARPNVQEEELFPHRLYGFVPSSEAFSTGRWLDEVASYLTGLDEAVRPIIVGGTGLYFKALTEGFATIPSIPDKVRNRLRSEMNERGAAEMHWLLQETDPLAACDLKPGDSQRILRALEVKEVTGQSILWWQKEAQKTPLLDGARCRKLIALPQRAVLYERINQRFEAMVGEGALEEVAALKAQNLDPALPAVKAIGVPQLSAYLDGALSLDEAINNAQQESRRYAKRQMTWLRNQMGEDWERVDGLVG